MTGSIMVPVDLAHKDVLETAVMEAGILAKAKGASITIVGVTGSAPSEAAHTPGEFDEKLSEYSEELAEKIGVPVAAKTLVDVDVAGDLGSVLIKTANDMGVDLIVMASHRPGLLEHIYASNAGYVANHAQCSVYVVR